MSKQEFNKKQIFKIANNKSLMDAVCHIDTVHETKGTFNKKVVINVNAFDEVKQGKHKEKFAAFYWDIEDALIIADDIVNGRFETISYLPARKDSEGNWMKQPTGKYTTYGGGKIARMMTIVKDKGRYNIQVGYFEATTGKNGSVIPNTKKPIDSHSILSISDFDMRKAMRYLIAHIEGKITVMNMNTQPTQQKPQNGANTEGKQATKPVKEEDDVMDFIDEVDFDAFGQ